MRWILLASIRALRELRGQRSVLDGREVHRGSRRTQSTRCQSSARLYTGDSAGRFARPWPAYICCKVKADKPFGQKGPL
jgi:hypothetical protein